MKDNSSLLDLFIPPEGYFGDFGMLCGFTATRKVLEQIKSKFSGETSKPVLAAFIHPTVNAVCDVPGMAWIWMNTNQKERGYVLLHAKVALLGFRRIEGDGYIVRLSVCTGNWTEDPLTNSIDLYWSIDLDVAQLTGQECADVHAAWELFEWLRQPVRSDTRLLQRSYDSHVPDSRLRNVIQKIAQKAGDIKPRFMDNREVGLMSQVTDRMKSLKPRTKVNRLIIGSGFYETGEISDAESCVPELIRTGLKNKLSSDAILEVVLNSGSCQGMAGNDDAPGLFDGLKRKAWRFKSPCSLHHNNDAKLHAKFLLLASGVKAKDKCTGQLYLGSGNMTHQGFVNAAGGNGNIEVGVVFDMPHGMIWGKSTKKEKSICELLPLTGKEISDALGLKAGHDFERPFEPELNPPVAYLIWDDGQLKSPEDGDSAPCIYDHNDQPSQLPCAWPDSPPLMVRLVEGNWLIPVVANDVFVRPMPMQMTVEDILAGLTGFPVPAEKDSDKDADPENGLGQQCKTQSQVPESQYAIRRVMQLLVALTQVQGRVVPNDWQRWCRELEENLIAISKYEVSMIQFFIDAGANPLGVLLDERMRQKGTDAKVLQATLERVSKAWFSDKELPCLWAHEGVLV
jgi:hypothetical protein